MRPVVEVLADDGASRVAAGDDLEVMHVQMHDVVRDVVDRDAVAADTVVRVEPQGQDEETGDGAFVDGRQTRRGDLDSRRVVDGGAGSGGRSVRRLSRPAGDGERNELSESEAAEVQQVTEK